LGPFHPTDVWRDDSFVDLRGKLLLAQGPCYGAVDYAIRVARTIKISRLKIGKAKAELPKSKFQIPSSNIQRITNP